MKKIISNLPKILVLALVGWGFSAHAAHAGIFSGIDEIAGQVVYQVGATGINLVLHVVAYLLLVVGMLLDISINLTMHIKSLVNSIPAIYQVWTTIRDISGLFFIFFLLYAAFKIILGFDGKYGDLIKNIVIAGILINFSFFITSVLIDMSNMVSLAIYNAMLPGQEVQVDDSTSLASLVNTDKGHALSAAFMQGLSIPTVFDAESEADKANSTQASKGVMDAFLKIILIGTIGIMTIVIAAISFFIASIAFIVRLFVLIFLLAFSPLWFASWVIPDLKSFSKKFTDMLYSQLVFMPVYLLLMYAALSILATNHMFGTSITGASAAGGTLPMGDYVVLLINAVFVIFMLNLPLFAGLSIGGLVTGKKWGADTIGKWVGKKAGSWAGRNTAGRLANMANNSATLKSVSARVPSLGIALSKQLDKVEKAGFGEKKGSYKDTVDAQKKAYVDMEKKVAKPTEVFVNEKAGTVGGRKYDNVERDKDGKTEFDKMKATAELNAKKAAEERSKKFVEVVKEKGNATIMGRMMNTAVSATKDVPVLGAATQSMASTMNAGGRQAAAEINKVKKDEQTKAEKKTAEENKKKLENEFNDWDAADKLKREQSRQELAQIEQNLAAQQAEIEKIRQEIESEKGINNLNMAMGRPSTSAKQEASLVVAKAKLDELQAAKAKVGEEMNNAKTERIKKTSELAKAKREFDSKIEAGKAIEEKDRVAGETEAVKSAAREAAKEGASSASK